MMQLPATINGVGGIRTPAPLARPAAFRVRSLTASLGTTPFYIPVSKRADFLEKLFRKGDLKPYSIDENPLFITVLVYSTARSAKSFECHLLDHLSTSASNLFLQKKEKTSFYIIGRPGRNVNHAGRCS